MVEAVIVVEVVIGALSLAVLALAWCFAAPAFVVLGWYDPPTHGRGRSYRTWRECGIELGFVMWGVVCILVVLYALGELTLAVVNAL